MCMSVLQHLTLLYRVKTLLSLWVNLLWLKLNHNLLQLRISLRVITSQWSLWQLMLRADLVLMLFSSLYKTYVLRTWFCSTSHICSHSLESFSTCVKSNTIEILLQLSCVLLNDLLAVYHDIFIWYSFADALIHILILWICNVNHSSMR